MKNIRLYIMAGALVALVILAVALVVFTPSASATLDNTEDAAYCEDCGELEKDVECSDGCGAYTEEAINPSFCAPCGG